MAAKSSALRIVASILACTLTVGSLPTGLRADNLSNNTVKLLSDNTVSVSGNTFYTPISMTNNITAVVQLAGGPYGAIAGAVFSLISSQLAKDDSNRRFDEINEQLHLIRQQLKIMDAKLDRIDLALREIDDKQDEILDAVHDVPAQVAFHKVLADIGLIEDHWKTWTKTTFGILSPTARTDMTSAYHDLTKDAANLYSFEDPSYTAALAMALRLNLDLAVKLNLSRNEIEDLKKGYRRFLDASLAPAQGITPGEPVQVNPQDSFPTRLLKRKTLIKTYLGTGYSPGAIVFAFRCSHPWEYQTPDNRRLAIAGDSFDETAIKDSFVWDPPAAEGVVLQLIRAKAVSFLVGPVDPRISDISLVYDSDRPPFEGPRLSGATPVSMVGSWDLVAAVRNTGTMFEYVGAYYRPTRLDDCQPGARPNEPHFGVLTGTSSSKTAEEFFKRYGNISDSELNIYSQEKLVQVNRQLRLMALETMAFAATSEFREYLRR